MWCAVGMPDREITPPVVSTLNSTIRLQREVREGESSWSRLEIPACPVPSMLTRDEMRYYHYITSFYAGLGDVVEIGPWIGSSTYNIVGGLCNNPAFGEGRRLYVYDDFVWRKSWMDKWLVGTDIAPLEDHAFFLPLFRDQTKNILIVSRRRP